MGSNPIRATTIKRWPIRLRVRTPAFQADKEGSTPSWATKFLYQWTEWTLTALKNLIIAAILILAIVASSIYIKLYLFPEQEKEPMTSVPEVIGEAESSSLTFLQLSSHKTIAQAEASLDEHYRLWPELIHPGELSIYRVTLPNGTWFRVGKHVDDRESGESSCELIKDRGGDCLVLTFDENRRLP